MNNLGLKFYWELWKNYLVDEMHRHVSIKIKNRIERNRCLFFSKINHTYLIIY